MYYLLKSNSILLSSNTFVYNSLLNSKLLTLNNNFSSIIARNGHLNVLKWARLNGCPLDENICWSAAENGHLDMLKWARLTPGGDEACLWNELTCYYAKNNGHQHILDWTLINGDPCNGKYH